MCGLFGFVHYGENQFKNLRLLTNSLAQYSAMRGTDATGMQQSQPLTLRHCITELCPVHLKQFAVFFGKGGVFNTREIHILNK